MVKWSPNDEVLIPHRLIVDGTEITTGTMALRVWRDNAGTIEDLQANETTWSAVNHEFAMTHNADSGWLYILTAPSGTHYVGYSITHSVYGEVESGTAELGSDTTGGLGIRLV